MEHSNGLNKQLRDKRLELGLDLKQAAKLLKYNKTHLRLIEEGYLPVRKRKIDIVIEKYGLPKNFFENDLGYPTILKESEVKYHKPWFYKVINALWFKITCFVLCAGFIGLTAAGTVCYMNTKTKPLSYYDQNVIETRLFVMNNYDTKMFDFVSNGVELGDTAYVLNSRDDETTLKDHHLKLIFLEKEQNIVFSTIKDDYIFTSVFPVYSPGRRILVTANLNVKFSEGGMRVSADYFNGLERIGSIAANIKDKPSYRVISLYNPDNGKLVPQTDKNSDDCNLLKAIFESNVKEFEEVATSFFETEKLNNGKIPYATFKESFKQGSGNFFGAVVSSFLMLIFGLVFTVTFLALSLLYLFKRMPTGDEVEEKTVVSDTVLAQRESKSKLKKNLKIAPILPGNLLKFISISMIFVYSIGFLLLFVNIITGKTEQAAAIVNFRQIFQPCLIIAILLLFFVKLDYIQERKDYFLTNYFYFFCGLALYGLMLILNSSIAVDDTFMAKVGTLILDIIPGNFLWGILAFNMMVYLLFYNPETIKEESKIKKFRLLSIIPLSYLVISLFLEVGNKCWSWHIPFAVENLFFTKSVDLIIFAIGYTLFVYFYKKWTIKKFGPIEAKLYQTGNRYYFVKNASAALIVLIIGIIELIVHFVYPDNPLGIGIDYLIMATIPFILFYHPHHGQRNIKVDYLFLAFYDIAYGIGIVLILLGVLLYVCKVFL